MVVKRACAALAVAAVLLPAVGHAADAQVGLIGPGSDALIIRDGKAVPATAGAAVYAGDRVVTRAGGSANVAMAGNCTVAMGPSAMMAMPSSGCAAPRTVSFDEGRAGYAGSSSAFQQNGPGAGIWLLGAAMGAIVGSAAYFALHHDHHHHGTPTSP